MSIGTGHPEEKRRPSSWIPAKQTIKILTEQATGRDNSALEGAKARFHNQNIPFLRLNPENVDCGLDELDDIKLIDILWATLGYLRDKGDEIDSFAIAYAACQQPIQH